LTNKAPASLIRGFGGHNSILRSTPMQRIAVELTSIR
jgi:hypothetical protein